MALLFEELEELVMDSEERIKQYINIRMENLEYDLLVGKEG